MTRILLVRHGETSANIVARLDCDTPGPDLTELGQEQARSLVPRFATVELERIFASTMVRTQQTAAPLATQRSMPVTSLDEFREIEGGELAGQVGYAVLAQYFQVVAPWATGELDRCIPGAEDGHAFFRRFDAGLARATEGVTGTVAVFSHGAAIRVWAANRCTNIPGTWVYERDLRNTGSVLVERMADGTFELIEWHEDPAGGPPVTNPRAVDPLGKAVR